MPLAMVRSETLVHARAETLYARRQVLTRKHGQADLQDHREGHNTRSVRALRGASSKPSYS